MRFVPTVVVALACCAPASAHAQEYFGKFLDQLNGSFNPQAKPRPTFKVGGEFRFDDPNGLRWTTPAGFEVDGASIPQPFWSFIGGPFEGEYINASVIHDYYCDTKTRTEHDTHRSFYYGMRAAGVPVWKANVMYYAVATFGPKWKLTTRVTMSQTCTPSNKSAMTCKSAPKLQIMSEALPQVDLSDPEVLALALAKVNSVARTLRTSDGKILDVTSTGKVEATLESIERTSELHRAAFTATDVYAAAPKLGLFSRPEFVGALDDIKPWASMTVPLLSTSPVLTPASATGIGAEDPFRVDRRSREQVQEQFSVEAQKSNAAAQPQ